VEISSDSVKSLCLYGKSIVGRFELFRPNVEQVKAHGYEGPGNSLTY
jgi:hypothetical protein